jgi:hypothetical protein
MLQYSGQYIFYHLLIDIKSEKRYLVRTSNNGTTYKNWATNVLFHNSDGLLTSFSIAVDFL